VLLQINDLTNLVIVVMTLVVLLAIRRDLVLLNRKRAQVEPDGPSANVCMVKKSGFGKIRSWMKHGIEFKQEGVTLRSSYKPSFEGSFELMVSELDQSIKSKWLRNINDNPRNPN
jgi:hypothetical protein